MTEEEWLTSDDPEPMLDWIIERKSIDDLENKLRIYACKCVRSVWDQLKERRAESAVEVAERFAHGKATSEELEIAYFQAMEASDEDTRRVDGMNSTDVTLPILERGNYLEAAAFTAARDIFVAAPLPGRLLSHTLFGRSARDTPFTLAELARQAELLREVLGNPFSKKMS